MIYVTHNKKYRIQQLKLKIKKIKSCQATPFDQMGGGQTTPLRIFEGDLATPNGQYVRIRIVHSAVWLAFLYHLEVLK